MQSRDLHDRELLRSLNSGNASAFWTLWLEHAPHLLAVCLREMNGNRADAEDALHEAMLRAYDKLPRFAAGISSPRSWLIRMTSNVCKDIHRHRFRSAQLSGQLVVLHGDRMQMPEIFRNDREPDVDAATLVSLLPDRLREVFVLRFLQRTSYPEIARRLGLTCVTVRKRVQQSRERLRSTVSFP